MAKVTGTVKFYNQAKAFGFITPDDGSKDVFVHQSAIIRGDLGDGVKVSFNVESTDRGMNATDVEVID